MRIVILTVGKPRQSFVLDGIAEFTKRLQRFADVTLVHLKESAIIGDVEKYTKRAQLILLDEKGTEYTSASFAAYLTKQTNASQDLVFLIGGTDGHTPEVRALPHTSMALSKLTLPHEMALLFFIETLYRSLTIAAGHPYHRT
jgi:23S rRNA (pseudouridine1915-N3)-methyltransferase